MSEQKLTFILLLLLFIFISVSSVLKWVKHVKGQKLSVSQISKTVFLIILISLVFVVLICLPLMEQPRISNNAVLIVGILLIVSGSVLNVLVAKQLMSINFRMKGLGTPDRIISTGLFRIIRHPSSLGVIFIFIGWFLTWGALYCIYFAAPLLIIGVFIENKFEERNLIKHFGDQYKSYRNTTGMYFPKIKKHKYENKQK